LANIIPLLGNLAGGATALVVGALTLIVGSAVIAIAWFSSRLILSLIIVVIGIVIAFCLGKIGKEKSIMKTSKAENQTGFERAPRSTPPQEE